MIEDQQPTTNNQQLITIVGAGLVGSLLSLYLRKQNFEVKILERRKDPRTGNVDHGRSINLALSHRGIRALKEAGVQISILEKAIPMRGRMIHDVKGKRNFIPYGEQGQMIYSVSRSELNRMLIEEAEKAGASINFNASCHEIDFKNSSITINQEGQEQKISSDIILGADGAFSDVRSAMQKYDKFNYSQEYLEHGYKELQIPAKDGKHQLEKNALHIWPREKFMLIALPNLDGSFTCTLFLPHEGAVSFSKLKDNVSLKKFFKKYFSDVYGLMPDLEKYFFGNPTSSLVTIKCSPWYFERTMLIGDAAHAIVPFYGQGMNCGFEDCVVLDELIAKHNENWETILNEYQLLRKPDSDAIADLAIANFVEVRDKTADPVFLLQKKIEARFSEKHPDKWIPLYTMVTFSPKIRYSKALQGGNKQQSIMDKIMAMPDIDKKWDSDEIEKLILSEIN
ncbi:MAG TPA: NAD(P)/FAD-dependent oxidoreductase [Cytophagaceae bacterium]|nr:NAD(P)/FAD-dependent oxidoreductase [Cytophagaceae bacterium]